VVEEAEVSREKETEIEEKRERVRLVRQAISDVKPNSENQQMPMDAGAAVAGHLAPELGSDPIMKAQGRYDMRRMGVSSKRLNMAKLWFTWRATEAGGHNRFWAHIVEEDDNRSPSIEGLGRRQAIQMQGATVGGHVPVEAPQRPNFFARHLWARDQEEEYQDYQKYRREMERGY